MCVAQSFSYQEEVLALIRKAQAFGLKVCGIEYESYALEVEGRYIINEVLIDGPRGIFRLGCLSAEEYIRRWLYRLERSA